MSTQQDIYAAGSENRFPMLNKENYVPWSSRLLRYAKSRPNEKLIHNSILNGPYVKKMIPEPGDANREIIVTETFHLQTDDELSDKELKQIEVDDQAIQTILLGLPEDIYVAVDSCETAQEIWLRVQQMMKALTLEFRRRRPSCSTNGKENFIKPEEQVDCSAGYEYGSRQTNPDAWSDDKEGEKTDESDDDDDDQEETKKFNDDDDDEEEISKIGEQEATESDEGDDEATENDAESKDEKTRVQEEESFDPIPRTPKDSEDDGNGEKDQGLRISEEERMQEEEEADELYPDLSKMELKKILIDKMEGYKSIQRSDEQRNLYKVLVEAYDVDKTILDTYEESAILKRRPSTLSEPATRSAGRSTIGTQSRQMSASESDFAEEPVQTTCQMEEPSHPVFETGAKDQPIVQTSQHPEWFSQPRRPPTPDRDWNKTLPAAQGNAQSWISESALDVYSKRRIIAVTDLKIVKWHNYKHLDWISLLNLTVEERFAFNVSLRMFTRSIVIQRRVEDLQMGVESYQKRLNLTKPDTYRSDLK
nr:hypothetical protein [Tanacetum cinerariifolium]